MWSQNQSEVVEPGFESWVKYKMAKCNLLSVHECLGKVGYGCLDSDTESRQKQQLLEMKPIAAAALARCGGPGEGWTSPSI